jgi:hypothetical protein
MLIVNNTAGLWIYFSNTCMIVNICIMLLDMYRPIFPFPVYPQCIRGFLHTTHLYMYWPLAPREDSCSFLYHGIRAQALLSFPRVAAPRVAHHRRRPRAGRAVAVPVLAAPPPPPCWTRRSRPRPPPPGPSSPPPRARRPRCRLPRAGRDTVAPGWLASAQSRPRHDLLPPSLVACYSGRPAAPAAAPSWWPAA